MTTPTTRARSRPSETPPIDVDAEKRVVEALIFVADEPITIEQIRQVLGHRSPDEIRALIAEVEHELEATGHGLRIEQVAGGFRLSTCPDLAPWVRTFFRHRNRARLSPASIETLAVIAYKQPVTAPEIQEIRGVDPQGSLRTLLEKRLVRMAGKKKVVGRPFLYATTRDFLVHFGLASIDDLPPIEDFEKLAGMIEAAADADAVDADGADPELIAASEGAHAGNGGADEGLAGMDDGDGPEGEGGTEGEGSLPRAARSWPGSEDSDDADDADDEE